MKFPLVLTVAILATSATTPFALSHASAVAPPAVDYGVTWTVDSAANALYEYAAGASGSEAPIATVSGASTGLDAPSSVAVSHRGVVYVANAGNDSITAYAANAFGNAPPIATIFGPRTGLDGPTGLTVVHGLVWLTDPASDLVEAFSTSSDGNALPAETIGGPKTKLDNPVAVSVQRDILPSITVINKPTSGKPTVLTYQTESGPGNVRPITVVHGTAKHPLVDPTAVLGSGGFGTVWIADAATNTLTLVLPFFRGGLHPVRVITGADTGLSAPSALSQDAHGDLLVANAGDHSVLTFSRHTKGDASPKRVLASVGTASGSPSGVAVVGDAPTAPVDLSVKTHGHSATLHWKPPVTTGGGIIGYDVIAFRDPRIGGLHGIGGISISGGGLLGGLHVDTTTTTFTRHIRRGVRYRFLVQAVNAFGASHDAHVDGGIVTRPGPPALVKVRARRTEAVVFWGLPRRDGDQRITGWRVQFATCVPGKKGCQPQTDRIAHGLEPYDVLTNLKKGTTYHLRIATKTASDVSRYSPVTSFTTKGHKSRS